MAKCSKKISFLDSGHCLEGHDQLTVLELALENQVPINNSCEGMGTCGTCLVEIVEGIDGLAPRNLIEQEMSDSRGHLDSERLACQTLCTSDLKIKLSSLES